MIPPTGDPAAGSGPSRPATRWAGGVALAAAVSALMLAPTLRPGFVLRLDMVFVPNPPLSAHALGLDGSVPRAVPMDFVVALLSHGLPADVVQKLLLLAIPVLGCLGMWRLLRGLGAVGQVAGVLAFSWNAYVYERLALGHWSLLLGVAVLPWLVAAAQDVRSGAPRACLRLVAWLGLACIATPTTGLVGVVVALAVLAVPERGTGAEAPGRRGRALLAVAGAGLLFTATWWVPGLVAATRGPADPRGVAAFAARSDTPLGTFGSLLTSGGIWDRGVVPPGRDSWAVAAAGLVLLAVAAAGLPVLRRAWGRSVTYGLVVVGVVGLLAAAAASTGAGAAALRFFVVHVPAAGLLRDGQKLLAPWLLVVSAAFGAGVARLHVRGLTARSSAGSTRPPAGATAVAVAAVALALLPLATLPGLAWGASGRLQPVAYPADYVSVQRLLAGAGRGPGDVLVLPWHLYRAWKWNPGTVALDPMQRLLARSVVVRDDLELGDRVVAGEDPRVPAVTAALARDVPLGPELARLGIGYVVLDRGTAGGPVTAHALDGLPVVFDGNDLAVYAVADPARSTRPSAVPIILGVDVAATAVWLGALVSLAWLPLAGGGALLQFRRRRDGTPR